MIRAAVETFKRDGYQSELGGPLARIVDIVNLSDDEFMEQKRDLIAEAGEQSDRDRKRRRDP